MFDIDLFSFYVDLALILLSQCGLLFDFDIDGQFLHQQATVVYVVLKNIHEHNYEIWILEKLCCTTLIPTVVNDNCVLFPAQVLRYVRHRCCGCSQQQSSIICSADCLLESWNLSWSVATVDTGNQAWGTPLTLFIRVKLFLQNEEIQF